MKGPLLQERTLRGSYGLAEHTVIGIALVLVDVARAHGFESGLQSLGTGSRRIRVRHADGVYGICVCPEDCENALEGDIVLPHDVDHAIARFEGMLSRLEREEGSRGNQSRLPSRFVGREEPAQPTR